MGVDTARGTALCLSGGGFRAMTFHVGALTRLNELGRLARLTLVSSVSGGSIAAATLAHRWPELDVDADGVARNLHRVTDSLLAFARRRVDIPTWARGLVTPARPGGALAEVYARHLFGTATLADLPQHPRFVLCATDMSSGDLVRLDHRGGDLPLAAAVAASSAFPPVFSPYRLAVPPQVHPSPDPAQQPDTDAWWSKLAPAPLRRNRGHLLLGDGGIHDNLGLDPALSCATVYVSDAGIPFVPRRNVPGDWLRQTLAAWKLATHEVSLRRRAEFSHALDHGERTGAVWHTLEDLSIPLPGGIAVHPGWSARLARVHTRLWSLPDTEARALVNLGYAASDAALRRGDPALPAAPGWPFPDVSLDAAPFGNAGRAAVTAGTGASRR